MIRLRHLNLDRAVSRFLKRVESLSRLPLITDAEMLDLYGEEVTVSAGELAKYNREAGICSNCAKRCCLMVRCELYDTRFSRCPIHNYRPAICRMHFCEKFAVDDPSFIREFADVYINSLLEAKLENSRKVDLFDSPPLSRYAPELVTAVTPWLDEFKESRLDEASALQRIQEEAEKFRTSPEVMSKIGVMDKDQEIALAEARYWIQGRLEK